FSVSRGLTCKAHGTKTATTAARLPPPRRPSAHRAPRRPDGSAIRRTTSTDCRGARPRSSDFDPSTLLRLVLRRPHPHLEDPVLEPGVRAVQVRAVRQGNAAVERAFAPLVQVVPLALFLPLRSEEHTSELQSRENLVCRL